jgi:predicted RNA-binding Zn ribbon-like protein
MVRIPFPFVAGAASLDFLNTEVMLDGRPADLLQNGDDLLLWLAESGLAAKGELEAVRTSLRESWFQETLPLRAGLRALFSRLADGDPLRETDLGILNDTLRGTDGTLQVQRGEPGRPSLAFQAHTLTPMFLIAQAAAEFLATADLALIRRCEGEGCILFFHDTTKSHTRRWCSMATCGNRTKVKAHYVRQKADP